MSIAKTLGIGILGLIGSTTAANASIRITEYMYSGAGGEFVELTNIGAAPIDMTGWSFDDDSRTPNMVDLSLFGVVNPGESVILTETNATIFRTDWGLAPTVDIIGGNTVNVGRGDEFNIYDASDALVDRLTYGDQVFIGTIRTQNISGWTTPDNLEDDTIDTGWVLSTIGDAQNSYASLSGDISNPGSYVVPEPSSIALVALGAAAMVRRKRK